MSMSVNKWKTNKTYLLIILLLSLSITSMFFLSWNSYIDHSGNLISPLIFLIISYLLIIILIIMLPAKNYLQQKSNTLIKEKPFEPEDRRIIENKNHVDYKYLTEKLVGKTDHGDIKKNAHNMLKNFATEFHIAQGIFYSFIPERKIFSMTATYAYTGEKDPEPFELGNGIHGQTAMDKKLLVLTNLPDDFKIVTSGLGSAQSRYLYIVPLLYNNETIALLEFTTFKSIEEEYVNALSYALGDLGKKWMQLNENG